MNTTPTNAEIRALAQQWFARLLAPDCSDVDRAGFDRWRVADRAHADAYREVEDVWQRSGDMRTDPAIAAALQEALRIPARSHASGRKWWPALAVAATVVLAITMLVRVLAVPEVPVVRYATVLGEQRTIVLPDGSKVVLDTATELFVQIDKRERNLTLQQGQAEFQVHKDASRPFVVRVGDGSVTATGTQFQVRTDHGASTVTLLEGRVLVAARVTDAGQSRRLEAGERVTIESSGKLGDLQRVPEPDLVSARGWTEGNLVVKAWSLEVVLSEMNRYSSTKLRLEDPSLGSMPISGVFKAGDQQSFAMSLEYGWPIRADQRPANSEIILSRK